MSSTYFVTRQELFAIMKSSDHSNLEEEFAFLAENIKRRTGCSEDDLNAKLAHFKSEFKSRWTKARRTEDRFLKANRTWLESAISFPRYESLSIEQSGEGDQKQALKKVVIVQKE